MSTPRSGARLSFAVLALLATVFATSADGQSSALSDGPDAAADDSVAPEGQQSSDPENRVDAESAPPGEIEKEVANLKAENAAVREQLRKMEAQMKALVEVIDGLQRKLEGPGATGAQPGPPAATEEPAVAAAEAAAKAPEPGVDTGTAPEPTTTVLDKLEANGRYQDGIVVWQTASDEQVPFLLRFNNNTQLRYLNTTSSDDTFTDHLGVVRDVHTRSDITVNRAMFILGGYMFDERLRYSSTVWTSAGAASIVVAANIGWQFNKALAITGGYTGVPGSRSLVNTFPFFSSTDRTMADNFFRPGFTQGLWANGEPVRGLYYMAFVGNGLNTLSISANKIDTNLLFSGSVWWEPLGDYGPPGKSRNMYDDYFASRTVRIRLGTSFTSSREDRFSNLDQSSPENTSLYNSDGVLTFSTGAFAPEVTVSEATYRMWAIDGGLKWNGLAINGQYFFRRLDDFEADGPLPLSSTYDHGFELVAGGFAVPRKLMAYGRGSMIFGEFRDSWEVAGGVKWYFLPTERLWLNVELMRVSDAPYSGAFTPYTAGMDAWVPTIQAVIAF